MKIIIAPDSFKGSLTSDQAANAIERGVRAVLHNVEIDKIPMADGGEGTLQALVTSTDGQFREVEATDPIGRPVKTRFGILGDDVTAVIEMAAVSGLLLLEKDKRNPLYTSTFGTGQLIAHAIDYGCRKIIIGIGGSATNDCGTGMAQALGVQFIRKNKFEIIEKMNGNFLKDVHSINLKNLESIGQSYEITAACDVKNPLLGEMGCARIYSPQKGASPKEVEILEENMKVFIDIAEKATHKSVRDIPGAGAAGGLGAGLLLFLGAELRPGIDIVMDACQFDQRIRGADLIITGEGKIDNQTAHGKTIAGIAVRAKTQKIPVVAFAGTVEQADNLYELGITNYYSISEFPISVEKSIANASILLQDSVERVMKRHLA